MAEQSKPKTHETFSKQNPTKTPLLSDIFIQKNLKKWPIKVNFSGCRKPHKNWANWVEKVSLKNAKTWVLTGICDGILSSLHEIKLNPEIILGLCEFWCSNTNTFVFPWGEATITLEDVNVLFGLPVLGKTVAVSPSECSANKNLERRLHEVKNAMLSCSCELDAWVNYFNEESNEVEHVGFLAFWLSSFVFPDVSDRTVGSHVFSSAVSLACGVKVALAPAVLVCLYRNLSFITQHAAEVDSAKREIYVPAAFQIVQLWALERFPWLGSKIAKPLGLGYPRIARWDGVSCKANLVDVRKSLRSSGDCFCWRPYALNLEGFCWRSLKSYYIDNGKALALLSSDFSGEVDEEELESFRVCLQPQELIGFDCNATYQPQRVMMQFGCDQKVCSQNKMSNELKIEAFEGEVAITKGIEQVPNDENDNKKLILASETLKTELHDEGVVSAQNEILNVSRNDIGAKQNSCKGNAERSTEDLVRNGEDGNERLILTSETVKTELNDEGHEANASLVSEVQKVSRNDNGTKQTSSKRNGERPSMEDVVILVSDEELEENSRCKDDKQSRSNTKSSKRRLGESADYPVYINEYTHKVVKKSGATFATAIDVENY